MELSPPTSDKAVSAPPAEYSHRRPHGDSETPLPTRNKGHPPFPPPTFYEGQMGNLGFQFHLAVTRQHLLSLLERCQQRRAKTEGLN